MIFINIILYSFTNPNLTLNPNARAYVINKPNPKHNLTLNLNEGWHTLHY